MIVHTGRAKVAIDIVSVYGDKNTTKRFVLWVDFAECEYEGEKIKQPYVERVDYEDERIRIPRTLFVFGSMAEYTTDLERCVEEIRAIADDCRFSVSDLLALAFAGL
jgi:hypothetical protein